MDRLVKQAARFNAFAWVALLLSSADALAQSRVSGELGRGFPYSSGDSSWGPWIFVIVLFVVFCIAAAVKDKLKDQPWWHTVIVVAATLLSSVALTAQISPYPGETGLMVFMLIPCFAVVALLYLAIMGLVKKKQD